MANEEYEVKVTQDGKVVPTTGSIIKVTLHAQGTGETNEEGNVIQRYIVIKLEEKGFALVAMFGWNKGKVMQKFSRIHNIVEALNENSYVKDWVVEE